MADPQIIAPGVLSGGGVPSMLTGDALANQAQYIDYINSANELSGGSVFGGAPTGVPQTVDVAQPQQIPQQQAVLAPLSADTNQQQPAALSQPTFNPYAPTQFPPQYTQAITRQMDIANDMLDPNSQMGQQAGALQGNVQQAYQQKQALINQAIQNLTSMHEQQNTNLPLLVAAGKMLAPTKTGMFGESVSNAVEAAAPLVQEQRQRDLQFQNSITQLQMAGADTGTAIAQSAQQDFMRRVDEAQKALSAVGTSSGRIGVASTNMTGREGVADINQAGGIAKTNIQQAGANARTDATNQTRLTDAQIQSDKNRYAYQGNNQDANSKAVNDANTLVQKGVALDFQTAYGMVRSGVNDSATVARLVQGEANNLRAQQNAAKVNNDTTNPAFKWSPQDIENTARANVMSRFKLAQPGGGAAQTATPAAAPAKPAAAAQPAIAPAHPDTIANAKSTLQSWQQNHPDASPQDVASFRKLIEDTSKAHGQTLPPVW